MPAKYFVFPSILNLLPTALGFEFLGAREFKVVGAAMVRAESRANAHAACSFMMVCREAEREEECYVQRDRKSETGEGKHLRKGPGYISILTWPKSDRNSAEIPGHDKKLMTGISYCATELA